MLSNDAVEIGDLHRRSTIWLRFSSSSWSSSPEKAKMSLCTSPGKEIGGLVVYGIANDGGNCRLPCIPLLAFIPVASLTLAVVIALALPLALFAFTAFALTLAFTFVAFAFIAIVLAIGNGYNGKQQRLSQSTARAGSKGGGQWG